MLSCVPAPGCASSLIQCGPRPWSRLSSVPRPGSASSLLQCGSPPRRSLGFILGPTLGPILDSNLGPVRKLAGFMGDIMGGFRDVQSWLAKERRASYVNADMMRLRALVRELSRSKPRQEVLRPLHRQWQVAQKRNNTPRRLSEVIQEFTVKAIKLAQSLVQENGTMLAKTEGAHTFSWTAQDTT